MRCRALAAAVTAVLACGSLGATAARAACGPTGDSGIVDVSNTATRSEGEESISVDPINPQWVIVGANEGANGGAGNGANEAPEWWSHDGGCTWHGGGLPDAGGVDLASTFSNVGPLGPLASGPGR